ncbi:hypothetical protein NLG97_g3441 [Lecanicillium saksenae]|uniref:Uncharacterized protein n=1 Tax=Lecanicillium saksenae TaxID=468837 RepID=A0ACC1R236_9HYPO|nr:hypothetical protein NLG97_g3441 [Lecanicillium saksenae]
MRFFILLAVCVAAVLTEGLNLTALTEQVPKCAIQCAMAGPGKAGCGLLDMECICARLPNISALGAPCMVEAGCKLDDIMKTGIVIVGECEKEYARTHNGSTEGMYALPTETGAAKTGAAAALYGTGWAVISAAFMTATAFWL